MAKVPLHPKNPERICWGCDKYCPADSLACGNGTVRTQHPVEIFGEDWLEMEAEENPTPEPVATAAPSSKSHDLTPAASTNSTGL